MTAPVPPRTVTSPLGEITGQLHRAHERWVDLTVRYGTINAQVSGFLQSHGAHPGGSVRVGGREIPVIDVAAVKVLPALINPVHCPDWQTLVGVFLVWQTRCTVTVDDPDDDPWDVLYGRWPTDCAGLQIPSEIVLRRDDIEIAISAAGRRAVRP